MRISVDEYLARHTQGRQIAGDFDVEDVWALPVHGGPGDFARLRDQVMPKIDMKNGPAAARFLWVVRDMLGKLFGLGRIDRGVERQRRLPIPGSRQYSLTERLPDNLRGTVAGSPDPDGPFTPVFATTTEYLSEMSNSTVHGAMHLLWVNDRPGEWSGQMAVLVKPRGVFGRVYMAFIKPFRYVIVYPVLMRMIGQKFAELERTG